MDSEEFDVNFEDDEIRLAFTGNEYGDGQCDFSGKGLENFPAELIHKAKEIRNLHFTHNTLKQLPPEISTFVNLVKLDLSNNNITCIHEEICHLKKLNMLSCCNNNLNVDSIPKDFGLLNNSLEYLNVSSNNLSHIPPQFLELTRLRRLYLGNNKLTQVSCDIGHLTRLEVLYLGGNRLQNLPSQVGHLHRLTYLILADNQLSSLPNSLSSLCNLKCLSLHNNNLATLPPEIIKLNLLVISLRGNPLVFKFAEHLMYEAPSLKELCARVVKVKGLKVDENELPSNLVTYLQTASHCVNPKCKGVYFSSRVEQIKFVDFCGLYRLPLLHYLCSPQCSKHPSVPYSSSESEGEDDNPVLKRRLKKVLLG